jgi:hypothetical protein
MIHKIIVIAFLFIIVAVWWFGLYPVATVNFNPVFKRDFDAKFSLSKDYLLASSQQDGTAMLSDEEIRLEVLNSMVQQKMVEELAKKDFPTEISDIKRSVEDRINKELEGDKAQQLKDIGQSLSGTDQTKNLVNNFLKPAEFIAQVSDKVTASGKDFVVWYKENAGKEHVYIFLPNYTWDSGQAMVVKAQ